MAVTKVVMPKLSEAMETGKLLRWLKQEGDRISGGDIIAEIETDKADIELEAFGSGVLRKLLATPGTAVPVGGLIAVIAEAGEDISAVVGGAPARPAAPSAAPSAPAPAAAPVAAVRAPAAASAPSMPAPAGVASAAAVLPPGRLRVSPLARKLAQRASIDLARVTGTGPGGRIIQRDIEASSPRGPRLRPGARPSWRRPCPRPRRWRRPSRAPVRTPRTSR
jgi:pyruvate dehydrogenase E2 component (dihydrolipoamide acetyltransferase)